jgi:hypothetical protein
MLEIWKKAFERKRKILNTVHFQFGLFQYLTQYYVYCMVVFVQLPMQSVSITTNVVRSNPAKAIHYVMRFVSDLRQVDILVGDDL